MDEPLVRRSEEVRRMTSVGIDRMKHTELGMVAAESEETSSSSFGGSDSEVENGDAGTDNEAVSGFQGDDESVLESGFRMAFNLRKKRPTTHWRSFIQPLMWRLKWAELQMKNLESQAERYDRKIERNRKQKQVAVLKRKKRKRTETTPDLAAYLSRHSLFSYYENLKSVTGRATMHDKFLNTAKPFQRINIDDELLVKDETLSLQFGDNDNSRECLLRKIDALLSRVGILKDRAAIINSENAGRFLDMENFILPMLYNDVRSSLEYNSSPPNSGASQLMSEYASALPMPESAVSGQTEDFLDVNGSEDLASFADSLYKTKENNPEEVMIQQAQNAQIMDCGVSGITPDVAELGFDREDQPPQQTRTASKVTAPRRKRRKVRKRGPSRWS